MDVNNEKINKHPFLNKINDKVNNIQQLDKNLTNNPFARKGLIEDIDTKDYSIETVYAELQMLLNDVKIEIDKKNNNIDNFKIGKIRILSNTILDLSKILRKLVYTKPKL
jgi:peptidoglycan hydrolase CwlO-like protein